MPVRKVVRRSGKNFRGYFPSRKAGRLIGWESIHERDAILILEYTPEVKTFEEQPSEETYYLEDGTARTYYPDLRATYACGRVVDIEIKPSRKLENPELARKLALVEKRYLQLKREFEVWTELDFRAEPRYSKCKALHRQRSRRFRAD